MASALLVAGASAQEGASLSMGAPLGAAWGAVYGFPPGKDERFVEPARALGAGFTRVTLYWSQLEPKPGAARWQDLDAYLGQLRSPDEAILTLASASPWATQTSTWVFPSSPPKDMQVYEAFVRETVLHVKGRIKYFQNDPEPNNPFFWAGTAEESVAQQKAFYRAVKAADPEAVVILAGCDGLFDPTGRAPFAQQAASLAFFTRLIAEAAHDYDVFDLRLYGDPYTIPARAAFVRGLIAQAGGHQPLVATEYAGPTFFEFRANRKHAMALQGAGSAQAMRALMADAAALPIETQMFLRDAPEAAAQRLQTLQIRDLVVRNVLALSSGLQKTAFWDLWHDLGDPASANAMMFGSLRLLTVDAGQVTGTTALGKAYAKLTGRLGDATRVQRIAVADDPDAFAFTVSRSRGAPLLVAWRKPADPVQDAPAAVARLPWAAPSSRATTLLDEPVPLRAARGAVELQLGAEPVFVESP